MAETVSYWCYRCNRSIRVCDVSNSSSVCPHCQSGFIEAMEPSSAPTSPENRSRSPESGRHERRSSFGFRRSRRSSSSDRSPYNPVVIMRSPGGDEAGDGEGAERSYQLYYDEGNGSGLRPLPPTMSELLLGSRFDRLLDQLAQLDLNRPSENPPASKSAVETLPTIEIDECHVSAGLNCAICKEEFVSGGSALEMPCKHLYHPDCLLPWLAMRNSCPICRHELPGEPGTKGTCPSEPFGITIWRLPGGGYAVGRFSGTTTTTGNGQNDQLPVVYTETDGRVSGNANSAIGSPRSRRRGRNNNGTTRFFSNIVTCLRRFMSSSTSLVSNTTAPEPVPGTVA